jgi:hypothetical protein
MQNACTCDDPDEPGEATDDGLRSTAHSAWFSHASPMGSTSGG